MTMYPPATRATPAATSRAWLVSQSLNPLIAFRKQPDRQPQADPAQQEARKHQQGPLIPGQDQVNDQQLRVEPRQEGQPQDQQHRFLPPMPPLHRWRRRPQQSLAA
jgi:hypothetical protein